MSGQLGPGHGFLVVNKYKSRRLRPDFAGTPDYICFVGQVKRIGAAYRYKRSDVSPERACCTCFVYTGLRPGFAELCQVWGWSAWMQPSKHHSFIPHSPRVGDGGYIPRIPRTCGGWLHGWGGWAPWGGVRQCMELVVGCTHDPRAARGRARGAARKSTTQLNFIVRSSMQDGQDQKSRTVELADCCSCRPRNWLCSSQTAQTERSTIMHARPAEL